MIRRLLLLTAVAACAPAEPVPSSARHGTPERSGEADSVTVVSLARDPERYAGRDAVVRGRCLGWRGPAVGPPPRTRSDWQLGAEGAAVWVSGPFPSGCDGSGGGDVRVRGRVEVDTATLRSGERVVRAVLLTARS